MKLLAAVRTEFRRYRRQTELAIDQVAAADLDRRLAADGNSIAILMSHLSGNLKSRFTDFLTTDGEKPWRNRDREFEAPGLTREQLLGAWRDGWQAVDDALLAVAAAGPAALDRDIAIRKQSLTVTEALLRAVAHVATHTGQIVLLARHWAGASWQTLSIARGDSDAYAANPNRERGPDTAS